jgi:hypothetical protein
MEAPDNNKIAVFSNGTPQGLKCSGCISLTKSGGQQQPNSIL